MLNASIVSYVRSAVLTILFCYSFIVVALALMALLMLCSLTSIVSIKVVVLILLLCKCFVYQELLFKLLNVLYSLCIVK